MCIYIYIYIYIYLQGVIGPKRAKAWSKLYEEFARLAETRLAPNTLDYIKLA